MTGLMVVALNAEALNGGAYLNVLFTQPTETFSFGALIAAFITAAIYLGFVYKKRSGRVPSLKKIVSMVLPRRLVLHRSHLIDLALLAFSQSALVLLFAWMVIGIHFINMSVSGLMVWLLGPATPSSLDTWMVMAIMTVALYLAYEFSYWLDHYLSHRIPFLWEFHRVHHEAEVLSPLTNARVHPIDQVVFTNITAIITGTVNGVLTYAFGQDVGIYTLYGLNAILFVFVLVIIQLQHTHVWLPFTGVLGRILMSPAHHQIHHSTNPDHYDRNMGSTLCIFDWLFGTLYIPSKEREKLTFGVEADHPDHDHHTLYHALIRPFVRAYRHFVPEQTETVIATSKTPPVKIEAFKNKPLAPAE